MDITRFVVSSRDKALLYGDHSTYRTQLATRLLKCRKKLNVATKHRGKFHPKEKVTADQIASNHEYLNLQLLTAERAWAHAMIMKTTHTADKKGISGHARSHIVSRLEKAAKTADHLAQVLADSDSGATEIDILEAHAYAALLRGAAQFEKHSWEPCLRSFSTARVIYIALSNPASADVFKDFLSETIDPSIRYAAYQLKTPRSLPIPAIARRAFPQSDESLVARINKVDPDVLKQEEQNEAQGLSTAESASKTLTWRSREVRIEDAAIATAWAALETAKTKLSERLNSKAELSPKEMAAAYDDVLIVSQDAVDATKQAIDELKAERVDQGDQRMQSLYITRTAVGYEMISWRIGRNRILTGEHDGVLLDPTSAPRRKAAKRALDQDDTKMDAPGRLIARLKERVVLYDATLQSLESIKELPGVAADVQLAAQLDAAFGYFTALKSLAVARSHSIAANPENALALTKHAWNHIEQALPHLSDSESSSSPIRDIHISKDDAAFLHQLLRGEVQRCRALLDIANVQKASTDKRGGVKTVPLGDSLANYPTGTLDLENIVVYPPKLETIPVKPLYLDLAWNYIDYPSKKAKTIAVPQEKPTAQQNAAQPEAAKPQKRGWFGFGR